VGLAWGVTSAILLVASRLSGMLGPRGLVALERLMGLVLVTIAVQMTMSGIRAFWAG